MDFAEKWGKDVDEAVKLALAELRLTVDDVNVIVLEESSKGFFGLGSKLAKVRVEKKDKEPEKRREPEGKREPQTREKSAARREPPERPARAAREEPSERPEWSERKSERKQRPFERADEERPKDLEPVEEHPALEFIKDTTEKMGLSLSVTAMKNESSIFIDIEGKDSGTVIGKRWQTLDAIQYLTSLVANKDKEKHIKVVVDAEGYRSKREKTLEQLADRLAAKVVRTKRSVRLEPMNPYERKVIHAKLQGNTKVTTRSEGEEPYRRVIIELR